MSIGLNAHNALVASGSLIAKQALRHTPVGLPVVEFRLMHESTQLEAGVKRQVACEMPCVCLGVLARDIAALDEGARLKLKGFLAARSRRWPQSLVFHVTDFRVESRSGQSEYSS